MAEVRASGATFDEGTETLEMDVRVTNVADSPIRLKKYTMAMASFVNGGEQEQAAAGPRDFVDPLDVAPNVPIGPGESQNLKLSISSTIFGVERLIPLSAPQQYIAGVIQFENATGEQELVTVRSSVIPTRFTPQYLP